MGEKTCNLDRRTVLVLNKSWQAIHVTSPAEAFVQLSTGVATALDVDADGGNIRPVTWSEWLSLPVRESDNSVGTVRGRVRVPTVIVLARYNRVPMKRPRLTPRAIRARDGGVCQYTGRKLAQGEGNLDHVVPRSRGGKTTWDNVVLASTKVNTDKGNRTPEEAGLRLLKRPTAPPPAPATALIRKSDDSPADWKFFLR